MGKEMHRFLATIIWGLGFVVVSLFTVYGKASAEEMTILFTHDLHDNLYPHKIEENGKIVTVGGYARLATAIEEERNKHEQTILVDAGDFSMGTLFQTIFSRHSPTLRLMGELGYDAVTLGNHEFDFRAAGLADSLMAATRHGDKLPDLVASNIVYPVDEDGKMSVDVAYLEKAMGVRRTAESVVLTDCPPGPDER